MSPALATELERLPDYLSGHLSLSLTALCVGILLSLPLAFFCLRIRQLRAPVLMIASAVQTIPGLALLALMVPLLGQIGFLPAVIALILYSVLPVLRNTVTGIEEVDRPLIEAGKALGMTPNQLLVKVQLPLALPVIVAGVRTATAWVVGMATLATPVGATSLGNYIFRGLQTQNHTAVLVGCVAAAVLALILDQLIHALELAVARRSRRGIAGASLAMVAALAAGLTPGIIGSRPDSAPVLIGTKTFSEQYVLGQLLVDELAAEGIESQLLQSLGSTVAFDALVSGRIDAYVEYTGTIWANYMKRTDNPSREGMLRATRSWLRDTHRIELVAALGFENAYALAMTRARAQALGVRTIDDLAAHAPRLEMGGDYEFFGRPEWQSLRDAYGLEFSKLITMDSTLMYQAVATGEIDVITAFSSDGRIPAFDLLLLDDTRAALPPYDAVVLLGPRAMSRPDVRATLARLEGTIDAEAMRAANRHVDLNGGSVEEAAGLLEGRIRAKTW